MPSKRSSHGGRPDRATRSWRPVERPSGPRAAATPCEATTRGRGTSGRPRSTPTTSPAPPPACSAQGGRAGRAGPADDAQPARVPLVDLAAQFLRATPVSIYNSSSPEEIQYLAGHAEAEIAIVEDAGFLERFLKVRDELPQLEQIFVARPAGRRPARRRAGRRRCWSTAAPTCDELAAATAPDDLATLIYTSGTTGPPKGVMISQYNVVYTVEQLRRCFGLDPSEFAGQAPDLVPADGAHRRADDQPLPRHGARASASLAAPTRPRSPRTPARSTPRSCSACPGCGRRSTPASTPRWPPTRSKQQKFDEGVAAALRDQGRRARTAPRRRSSRTRGPSSTPSPSRQVRAAASGSTPLDGGHHRRGADPADRSSSGSTPSACR